MLSSPPRRSYVQLLSILNLVLTDTEQHLSTLTKKIGKDIHPSFIITSSCLFGLIYDSYIAHQSSCLQLCAMRLQCKCSLRKFYSGPIFTDSRDRFPTSETIREWVQAYGETISGIVWKDKR